MILILGQRNDKSTIDVAEWLLYYGAKFVIFYTEDLNFRIVKYDRKNEEFIVNINNSYINLYDITAVWNRRSGISPGNLTNQYINKKKPGRFFLDKKDKSHYQYVNEESIAIVHFIHYLIEKKSIVSIGSFFYNDVNKLTVLDIAESCGLKIPLSYIVTSKHELKNIINSNPEKNFITKAIYEGIYRPDVSDKYLYYSYVERLNINFIETMADTFFPSLVQEEIKKQLDLRAFFLKGKFYTMAIFSQDNLGASVDFRKNDHYKSPLKYVPYKLPINEEMKLTDLMDKLNLNTGSIDIILNENNEYIFLEVNPCGQYAMTSSPCNYLLDKRIAELLCEHETLY